MAEFVPSVSTKRGAQCSGLVSDLDEVRERFPSAAWCECMDDALSHGVAHAIEKIGSFTDGMEHIQTVRSAGESVDVYYQWESEIYVFTIDGRVGSRLSFDAIRDEEARPSIFAERAERAVKAIRWAEQDWQSRKARPVF
ncbi:hypothetical protein OG417_40020 [Actinoallomurus sp. NBC_01490]|uniref:hypothetical protein n=1 Tax=Actinoallomurus sp. NBC_01490 TaxID=2903557 RepID=UPI002E343956|nr:hypothetical protein [Actinoallomurus sp. NBC_01490]